VRYLLDTNVVRELRKGPAATPAVAAWANSVESADLGMSVLALGEIRHGIEVLRRRGYKGWVSLEAFDFTPGAERLAIESLRHLESQIGQLQS